MRFSIVIPVLDRIGMLPRAVASVRKQPWPDVEIIIVDGGSTDGTVEWARGEVARSASPRSAPAEFAEGSWAPPQAAVRLIEGPDRGVWDAINKGIAAASGDVVGILCSDDEYHPMAFGDVATEIGRGALCVCGSAALVDEAGRVLGRFFQEESAHALLVGSSVLNARFFAMSALREAGPFRLDYRYVSDRDWLMRWLVMGFRTVHIQATVYYYQRHAGSLTFARERDETGIRKELLRLAREWGRDLRPDVRQAAAALEGRCVAWLAWHAVIAGRWRDAVAFLVSDGRGFSFWPMASIARGGLDWIRR